MSDDWYEAVSEDHFWFKWRFEAMKKQILELGLDLDAELAAIDVGCGRGDFIRQLEQESVWRTDAADLNLKALEDCRISKGERFFYDINEKHPPLQGKYDIAFAYDVIEHIKDPLSFLNSIKAHLKENGLLFINVPALNSMFSEYDRRMGHCRRYNTRTLIDELTEAGYSCLTISYWGLGMLPLLIARKFIFPLMKHDDNSVSKGVNPPSLFKFPFDAYIYLNKLIEMKIIKKPFLGTSLMGVWRVNTGVEE
jgi:SAM-dependent methyltransferase